MVNHRKYYKGEDGAFPQVQVMINPVSLCMLVVIHALKMLQLCVEQLDLLVICVSPRLGAPTRPSYSRSVTN
jgi:hypothetical protein